MQGEIDKLQSAGIIRKSTSPWSSPTMLVAKHGSLGGHRLVVDYRRLNKVTIPQPTVIPSIKTIREFLGNFSFVSELDMIQGYFQIPVDEASIPLTAFSTPTGHYEFLSMPQGHINSPYHFNATMSGIFSNLPCVKVYFDNLIVKTAFPGTYAQHLLDLEAVFKICEERGVTLHPAKSQFAKKELNIFGWHIDRTGIRPNADKVEAIVQRLPPSNIQEVQVFLGIVNFYRTSIANVAKIATPLYRLTRKDQLFQWGQEEQQSFEDLKRALTSAPVLAFPDEHKPFTIHCDASGVAIGAVLVQTNDEGTV